GLYGAADSPKIGDLEQPRPACPHCDDDYNHRPIAKLEWEKLLPADGAELPHQTQVDKVIHHQRKRERAEDDPFYYGRFRPTDERCECEWQRDCEKDHKKMRDAVRMEGWRGIHCRVCRSDNRSGTSRRVVVRERNVDCSFAVIPRSRDRGTRPSWRITQDRLCNYHPLMRSLTPKAFGARYDMAPFRCGRAVWEGAMPSSAHHPEITRNNVHEPFKIGCQLDGIFFGIERYDQQLRLYRIHKIG